ncbi:short-chain dehydrogenase/reductase [Reticulibacter mediterranei]|uniref:Short-chain dehydrogenase/reductase n=1 Tax=Reticulibacter mediterranei TaxID=2778369 RepID=A0A8J3IL47_9CHLR|nr:SDR family oxidoreductase [Reticulibacter mediterranei]GHO97589.1 short-chain dehydrogenase/reductase [Reticulibacter mediterranei]
MSRETTAQSKQKRWLITGVSTGLGRAMTELLLERGDVVAGTVRDETVVSELQSKYAETFHVEKLDLTDFAHIKPTVDHAFSALRRVDVIINNAGYGLFGAAEEFTDEQILAELATNLTGSIQVTRASIPHLRAQQSGRIVQISTFGGQGAWAGGSMYHASKWGIEGFTEALIEELAPFGIGVTIIEPGSARTNFRFKSSQMSTPIPAYDGTPADAVRKRMRDTSSLPIGDPVKMAAAIIQASEQKPAPRRVVLGSDSYQAIHTQLIARLKDIEPQEQSAKLTDIGQKMKEKEA